MYWLPAQTEAHVDFKRYSAQGRGRASRILYSSVGSTVRGHGSWYPSRYDAMDGFRMGNYNVLAQVGLNLALEFIYGGPHTLLCHHHVPVISNATGSHSDQP
jgi:hypothetical protein